MAARSVWRVFYTRPRTEKKVADRLQRAGVDVCLPLRSVLRQWSDRKKTVLEPLFPSYLFAFVDERGRLDVLTDEGVVKSVSFGSQFASVRPEEIEMLRALEAFPDAMNAISRGTFARGTPVLVTSGALSGARGTAEGSPRPMYLTVEVPSIRQSIRIQVPADWVMRTDSV